MRRLLSPPTEVNEAWQPRLYVALGALVVVAAYVVAFVVKNDDEVDVDFVLFTAHVSLIWLILLILILGVLGGVLLSQLYRRRGRERGGE
ncbi:MAG: lipopolysaccharide assembly protein LapA domain-containing protein [Gaiellaceae bacterium]